jgi:predicted permease
MQILNSLLPIFVVIALGIFLRRKKFLTQEMTQGFNSFAYCFGLPLFLFYKLGSAPTGAGQTDQLIMTLFGATVVTLIVGWATTHLLQVQFHSRGAFIQACIRGNLAFVGLPLILFTIESAITEPNAALESAVLITLPPIVIFYNIAGVALLAIYNQDSAQAFSWNSVVRNMLLNPLLIACVGGVIFQSAGWTIPTFIERTCSVVGASAFPMALVGIGSQMAAVSVSKRWVDPLLTSVVKCLICPFAGWLIGTGLGLSGLELQAILILCAVPTAVSSFVLTDQMNGDSDLAASAVVIGTAFSLLPLSILLAIPF